MRLSSRWTTFVAHAASVAAFGALFVVLLAQSEPHDANIGAGLVFMVLLALGLPWSLPFFVVPYGLDGMPVGLRMTLSLAPAALNLVIHALLVARRGRGAPARPG